MQEAEQIAAQHQAQMFQKSTELNNVEQELVSLQQRFDYIYKALIAAEKDLTLVRQEKEDIVKASCVNPFSHNP